MARIDGVQTKGAFTRWAVYACVASLCFAIGGCDFNEKMQKTIAQRADETQQLSDAAKKVSNPVNYNPLTVTDKIWGGNVAVRMHRGMPLPPRYEESRGVTLVSSEPMSLNDIAGAVSAQTGIPIRLSSLSLPAKGGSSSSGSSDQEMPVSYEGPLSGLLDRLGAFFGVTWRFDGSAISILRYETRVFVVEAMPGTQEINEGMQDDTNTSSGSSSSGSSGTSSTSTNTLTQNSKTTMSLKYWDELSAALKEMISGQGSVVISPSMGTITVTTTPDVMSTVADYIGKENKRLSRQIAISVQIYTVNLGKSEDFSMAFKGFLSHLTGSAAGLKIVGAGAPGVLNSALSGSLGTFNVAILKSNGNPRSSNEVFKALSAVGNTSQVAQFSMTTLNNRPVSRRVGTDTAYVQSVTQSTTATSSTLTTYVPVIGTVREGFSLQLTPRLLDDGRILLQYSLSLIGLSSMDTADFSGNTVTLPVTDNRIFVQQSMLRSGQTLVIGGVDQETTKQNKQGIGSPDNFLLGGGTSGNEDRLMMFMALTPQVMDVSSDEERS